MDKVWAWIGKILVFGGIFIFLVLSALTAWIDVYSFGHSWKQVFGLDR